MIIKYKQYRIEIRENGMDFCGSVVDLSENIYGLSYGEVLDKLTVILDEYWVFEEFRAERDSKLCDWF